MNSLKSSIIQYFFENILTLLSRPTYLCCVNSIDSSPLENTANPRYIQDQLIRLLADCTCLFNQRLQKFASIKASSEQ